MTGVWVGPPPPRGKHPGPGPCPCPGGGPDAHVRVRVRVPARHARLVRLLRRLLGERLGGSGREGGGQALWVWV